VLFPIEVADIVLDHPLATIPGLEGYSRPRVPTRLHGVPIGSVDLPVINGTCPVATRADVITTELSMAITRQLRDDGLAGPDEARSWSIANRITFSQGHRSPPR